MGFDDDVLPVETPDISSLCSGFGPLLTVDDRARRGSNAGGSDCNLRAKPRSGLGHRANWQTGARSRGRPIEAFHEAVLHWLARGNVVPLDLAALLPFQDGV